MLEPGQKTEKGAFPASGWPHKADEGGAVRDFHKLHAGERRALQTCQRACFFQRILPGLTGIPARGNKGVGQNGCGMFIQKDRFCGHRAYIDACHRHIVLLCFSAAGAG